MVALPSGTVATVAKARHQRQCRPRTPSQNASLLQHLAAIDMGRRPDINELARTIEPQTFYDEFYAFASGLLDAFYHYDVT